MASPDPESIGNNMANFNDLLTTHTFSAGHYPFLVMLSKMGKFSIKDTTMQQLCGIHPKYDFVGIAEQ